MKTEIFGIIKIESIANSCFFHVLGDFVEYHDLESILIAHPELSLFIEQNKLELHRALLRQGEILIGRMS